MSQPTMCEGTTANTFICKRPIPLSSFFKLQHYMYIHLNPPLRSRPISLSYQAALTHFPPVYTLVMGVCEDRRPATGIGRRSSHTPHYKCVQCFSLCPAQIYPCFGITWWRITWRYLVPHSRKPELYLCVENEATLQVRSSVNKCGRGWSSANKGIPQLASLKDTTISQG